MNPIIVYCANQKEMDNWFGLLKEQIEANGGTAITAETYTDFKVMSRLIREKNISASSFRDTFELIPAGYREREG